ncbi:fungal-specific transcription factor domain-containing protein [Penicillium alfredii]|uniref:Fungal-specific transcription factor domain-containing protein n=1 Tax=Penicillium alfredii TaxID=1506179 RepID=A0A9W9FSA0_9EURO|nr:fungal-specific transcription factor domain-containing protein [Penicillium alfredii]KAJ5105095.1 fungal-specific transcription factor domain-containing protein [Penicillium alfredii]
MTEFIGSDVTTLVSSGVNFRLLLNANDTDLHPHTEHLPGSCIGPTEMLFCLTCIELTIAPISNRIQPKASTTVHSHNPVATWNPSTLSTVTPRSPFTFFNLLLTHASLCMLRVIDFMCRGMPTSSLDHQERDSLFLCAIQILEYDDEIYTTESLRRFLWFTQMHGPLPGYIFFVSELRQRATGELCERAWQAICNNYKHRSFARNLENPMHVAFGHTILEAWAAREQAELQQGQNIEPPSLVTLLAQRFSSSHPAGPKAVSSPNMVRRTHSEPTTGSGTPFRSEEMYETWGTALGDNPLPPLLEGTSQVDRAACPDYDWTNWTYLMQSGALGEFFDDVGSHLA